MPLHVSVTPPLDIAETRRSLLTAAQARRQQLSSLPAVDQQDLVATAHRESVERILSDVLSALDRIEEGTFGQCGDCGARMDNDLLLDRPWAARCEWCVSLTM